ncbi:MAG TPA: MFS transporter, partial [Kofleriaceae bacterium]
MKPLIVGSARWIAVMSALSAVTALSLDMSLPAQPALAERFSVPAETAGLTLTAFLVAFAFAQLLVGPLSDALGRKPVLMAGLTLFTLGGAGCAIAPSIATLIMFRMLQGLGAAAAPVLARAMVRDARPDDSARILSTMLAGLALAPMLAPAIGGVVLDWSWRWIFALLAGCGALLFWFASRLAETHSLIARSRTPVVRGALTVLRVPGIGLPMFVSCATFT